MSRVDPRATVPHSVPVTTTVRVIKATPAQVWAVLGDGWLYPAWVVGASRMREVSERWPEVGTIIDHSVGSWPALIDDVTEVVRSEPERCLRLWARANPAGEASVELRLEPVGGGTRVEMEEHVTKGPGRLVPEKVAGWGMRKRNEESLRRLAFIAERRH